MNKILKKIGIVSTAVVMVCSSLSLSAEIKREHRAIWASAYLSRNWPSTKITEANANSIKLVLQNRLDQFRKQNINIIYYHVRSHCDAMYNSAYEPWSAQASGTRGVAPFFDPFEFLVAEAHARGIEVYAWFNPYRYHSTPGGTYGAGELNYENSHPEWLISGNGSRTLNPGLEPVKQRIVDVCKDVLVKYDVDGVIFDDYFYPDGGTNNAIDAGLYEAYVNTVPAGQTPMTQGDWRRANVNEMVRRVAEMIAETKPYVRFGISPAAVASPSNVETEYGLPMYPGDWQYNQIYSDPLNWLKNQYIDYISPQVYRETTSDFCSLSKWWSDAAKKFGRHLYVSTSNSDIGSSYGVGGAEEFVQQELWNQSISPADEAGMVYFEYGGFINYKERYKGGPNLSFGDILQQTVFQNKVLAPLMPWRNKVNPVMTSNVKIEGSTLTWDAVEGMRYTVYAVPENISDAEFGCQREYLDGISYTNSYAIPTEKATGYRWAVAVYDRYGNEYAPLFAGATATKCAASVPTYPTKGQEAPDMFTFKWTGEGTLSVVEVAEDAAFTKIIATKEVSGHELSSTAIASMVPGKTYYWRVKSHRANAMEAVSAVESFVATHIKVTYPLNGATGISVAPTITWTPVAEGAKYFVEISQQYSDTGEMMNIILADTVETASIKVPSPLLYSYKEYFVKVTAILGENKSQTDVVSFTTEEVIYTEGPTFKTPSMDGTTLYSNECIELNPWLGGWRQVKLQIATSSTFPTGRGGTKTYTLQNFECKSDTLGKLSLTNGTTYYVRAYGEYTISTSSAYQKTNYSNVYTFVYSSDTGVDGVNADNKNVYITPENVLVLGANATDVAIFAVSGQLIANVDVNGLTTYDLSSLASGAYIVKVKCDEGVITLKYVK